MLSICLLYGSYILGTGHFHNKKHWIMTAHKGYKNKQKETVYNILNWEGLYKRLLKSEKKIVCT